jgi:hypothetical protein
MKKVRAFVQCQGAKGMMVVLKIVRDIREVTSQVNILMDEIRKITGQIMGV